MGWIYDRSQNRHMHPMRSVRPHRKQLQTLAVHRVQILLNDQEGRYGLRQVA